LLFFFCFYFLSFFVTLCFFWFSVYFSYVLVCLILFLFFLFLWGECEWGYRCFSFDGDIHAGVLEFRVVEGLSYVQGEWHGVQCWSLRNRFAFPYYLQVMEFDTYPIKYFWWLIGV